MNFEGFKDLIRRVAQAWYKIAVKEIQPEYTEIVANYLNVNPLTAKQNSDNELAYEKLTDVRLKLYELSYEIDRNNKSYMEFMKQTLDQSDLLECVTEDLSVAEKHLVILELMLMEQVSDLELDYGQDKLNNEIDSEKNCSRLVVFLPNGSTRTVCIQQEVQERYWFGICPVSQKIGNLKLCLGCKVVSYVGRDEQKSDWNKHKVLCSVFREARGQHSHWIEAGYSSEDMQTLMKKKLKRNILNQFELDCLLHPRICSVCGTSEQEVLSNCQKCFSVAFCSEHIDKGKLSHEPQCHLLETALRDYQAEITFGHQVQNYEARVNEAVTDYKSLPFHIEAFFENDISRLVSNKCIGYQESELRYLTFLYTCPLTVLYAAELIPYLDISHRKSLTLHLVGSRIAEMRHLIGWEVIVTQLPLLESLTIVFIGDEVPKQQEFPRDFQFKSKVLQNTKTRKNIMIRYVIETPGYYQEYYYSAKSITHHSSADMIIALDCGFKYYASWKEAIKLMLSRTDVPLVFTEFNLQDTKDDLLLVERNVLLKEDEDLDIIVTPRRNPFCSRRPVRCSDNTGSYAPNSVIYTNDYICVVAKRTYL